MVKQFILKFIGYLLAVAMLLAGLLIFTYPLLSGYQSERKTATVIEEFEYKKNSYTSPSDSAPKDTQRLNELYAQMQKYNEDIYEDEQQGLCDAWSYEQASIDLSEYGLYNGAVGVLRVPKMGNLEMPIFLGASKGNMARGAAQLGETSLPIGGNNTNCVLAGHRGWNGARYFLDIEQLELGDMVYIENFWDTLSYKVTEIKIIDPDDIEEILIQDNKDMVTLFTCHPYWASTYRYAVFCTRVNDDTQATQTQTESTQSVSATESVTASERVIETDHTSQKRIVFERLSYVLIPLLLVALLIFLNRRRSN